MIDFIRDVATILGVVVMAEALIVTIDASIKMLKIYRKYRG